MHISFCCFIYDNNNCFHLLPQPFPQGAPIIPSGHFPSLFSVRFRHFSGLLTAAHSPFPLHTAKSHGWNPAGRHLFLSGNFFVYPYNEELSVT